MLLMGITNGGSRGYVGITGGPCLLLLGGLFIGDDIRGRRLSYGLRLAPQLNNGRAKHYQNSRVALAAAAALAAGIATTTTPISVKVKSAPWNSSGTADMCVYVYIYIYIYTYTYIYIYDMI